MTTSVTLAILIATILLIFSPPTVESVHVDCIYDTQFVFHAIYTCKVANKQIFDGPQVTLDSARGTHKNRMTHDDVAAVYITENEKLRFFPKGIDKLFDDLIGLAITDTGLAKVTQDDLKPFPKLKYIRMTSNKIEKLDRDMFQFNLQLIWIDFRDNPITHIAPHIFDQLPYVEATYFEGSECFITNELTNKRAEVLKFMEEINNGVCNN